MTNKYSSQIRERWTAIAPNSIEQMEDPQEFFDETGEQVLQRVEQILGETSPAPTQDYLESVGQLTAATRQAEELAMAEVPWPALEMTDDAARQEWEATRPQEQALIDWATSQEQTPFEDELETLSSQWQLPTDFLRELSTATNPSTYLAENSETIRSSQEARYRLHLQQ